MDTFTAEQMQNFYYVWQVCKQYNFTIDTIIQKIKEWKSLELFKVIEKVELNFPKKDRMTINEFNSAIYIFKIVNNIEYEKEIKEEII